MVPTGHGALLPWYHGAMVPWCHGTMAPGYHGTTVRHRLVFIAGAARWQLLFFLAGGPALFYLPRPHFIFSALARALPLDENWQGQSQQN